MTLHQDPAPSRTDTIPGPAAVVQLEEVSVSYRIGNHPILALDTISCDVLPGEHLAVTGPSGSGKSTLLHVMAGLQPITTGRRSWPVLDGSPRGRPTAAGLVFQSPSLLAPLNVIENVELPLLLAGSSRRSARHQAQAALDQLDLGPLALHLPEELSGGQAQRVAVARVMATQPALVLADEPSGQLDHATADQVITALVATCEQIGAALVVSTHDLRVAARFDRRWTMSHGVLDSGGSR